MTSKEIAAEIESLRAEAQRMTEVQSTPQARAIAREYLAQAPLWEIARQLAELNERQSRADVEQRQKARGMKR